MAGHDNQSYTKVSVVTACLQHLIDAMDGGLLMTRYLTIDLFCGAGGITQGFKSEGFDAIFANDTETSALETFKNNFPGVELSCDSVEVLDATVLRLNQGLKKGELDVLVGGPPCQGFSTYGKRNPADTRNQLYNHYIRFLDEYEPKAFLIENVVGILSMGDGKIVEDILKKTRSLGYNVHVMVLDAASFGIPQFRKRVFFMGSRKEFPKIEFPLETHANISQESTPTLFSHIQVLNPFVTVRDAISDLPASVLLPSATNDSWEYTCPPKTEYQKEMRAASSNELFHHSSKQMLGIRKVRLALMRPGEYGTQMRKRLLQEGLSKELLDELMGGEGLKDIGKCRQEDRIKEQEFRAILSKGHVDLEKVLESLDSGGFANKYRRLLWDQPSHTLVAHMARDCSDFVHPDVDRFISVREAARLQSFPDSFKFSGSQFRQFKQIGNAVPPMLGAALARQIREYLEKHYFNDSKRKRVKSSSDVPISPK
jgi:DNA (cytosine-5)-methyltransferase 1